ncbi:MAG: GNAT family N-acetyltransferase [Candidatus Bathyarchaeota archaeon]|nr:MAG: GNAT family N-acetyltransferase [Candidatus Bathyarchaeota archaeon]
MQTHLDGYRQLNVELLTWIANQFSANYQIDVVSMIGQTVSEYVDNHLEDLASLQPPNGVIYLLINEGDIAGMGAIRKLSEETGEIKRMYIRPRYRGQGYGTQMLEILLAKGREFSCSKFVLETSKFMTTAQHIYRSAGFREGAEYPESETPPILRSYQLYMEKIS